MSRERPTFSDDAERDASIERLFREHHPAVLRVTQAVLKGRAEARDAAQEVFLKALQNGGEVRSRPWLLRCAANGAIDERRRQGRRGTELLEEPPARSEDPARRAERSEWERKLLRALLDLGPEHREPLILHFWDGCSMGEVGRRLRIPRSTAHKRCRQGLGLLRDRLSIRRASVPLLGLLLHPRSWFPALTTGGSVMASKSLAIAAGIVLLLCVPFMLSERDGVDEGPSQLDSGLEVVESTGDGKAAIEGEGASAPTPIAARSFVEEEAGPDADLGEGWVVRGRLILGDRSAPKGRELRARIYEGWWDSSWREEDRDGLIEELRLPVLRGGVFAWKPERAPERSVTLVVRGEAEGFLPATVSRFVLGGSASTEELRLTLQPLDAVLQGVVRNAEGEAVPDASARCLGRTVRSGADGRYRMLTTSRRSRLRVFFWAEGYAVSQTTLKSPLPGQTAELDLVLEQGVTVSGTVVDERGQPIPGATLSSGWCRPRSTTAGVDGSYVMRGFSPRQTLSFTARAPGFVRTVWYRESATVDLVDQKIVMKPATRFRVRVLDPEDQPLEGARVGIGQGFGMGSTRTAITDPEGWATVEGVGAGERGLHVKRSGFVQYEGIAQVKPRGEGSDSVIVRLGRGRTFRGRFVDSSGQGIAGIVAIVKKGWDYQETKDRSDVEGRFELKDLPGNKVRIEAYGKGVVRRVKTVPIGEEEVEIELERNGVVAGRALDRATGRPLSRFRVRVFHAPKREGETRATGYNYMLTTSGRWFSDPEGRFRIDGEEISVGHVIGVEVWAEGYAPEFDDRYLIAGDPEADAFPFRLGPAASFVGRVLDREEGSPVSGAKIRWRLQSEKVPSRLELEDARTKSSGRDGSFRFEDLPGQAIVLDVVTEGYPIHHEGPLTATPGDTLKRDIFLARGATLKGSVESAPGKVAAGVNIRLERFDSPGGGGMRVSKKTKSDARGRFEFHGLANGTWLVVHEESIGWWNLNIQSCQVRIAEPGVHEVKLAPSGDATLTLRLRGNGEYPTGQLIVRGERGAKPGVPQEMRTAVARDGVVTFPGLASGPWRFRVVHYEKRQLTVGRLDLEVAPREERTAELQLDSR